MTTHAFNPLSMYLGFLRLTMALLSSLASMASTKDA